jgi:MYXO-CTERM domain-containing protein
VTFASAPTVGTGGSLEKKGTGTLSIAAAVNAPALNVAITDGRLAVNGTLGNITLSSGATLGGSGTIGTATVAAGATVAPGNSPGIFTAGNTSYAGGSFIDWEVYDATAAAGVGYDKLVVNGDLNLTGASPTSRIKVNIISLSALDAMGQPLNFGAPNGVSSIRRFEFAQVNGSLLTGGQNISDLFEFNVDDFRYTGGASSNAGLWSISWNSTSGAITLTAVPEPSTYGLGLGALALAAAALRRRRQITKA